MTITETEKLMLAIKAESAKIDMAMHADLDSLKPGLDPLLSDVLDYGLFNGGKRIRPILAVIAARLCGCSDDRIYELAKAFEYLHAATLFHDDVIDNADTRRGRPAVNKQFGLIAAILAGDFLHARSMEIVGNMVGGKGLAVFCQATAGMVDGEFMQLRNAAQSNLSESDYYDAIIGKTGLLIAASCEVGALYGGGSFEQQKALRAYGVGLGCAFQMVDDLLDYTGDQLRTGKAVGNDLAEGKMTLPLIITLARANDHDRLQFEAILASPELRQTEIRTVMELITRYKGFDETRARAAKAVDEALAELALFTDTAASASKLTLQVLAQYVLSREK
jgi:octaprenyl-diphosphate synthase